MVDVASVLEPDVEVDPPVEGQSVEEVLHEQRVKLTGAAARELNLVDEKRAVG